MFKVCCLIFILFGFAARTINGLNVAAEKSPRRSEMKKNLDTCHITQACESMNNIVMPESHHKPTNLDSNEYSQVMPSNEKFYFKCTNYDPSVKYNGCRANVPRISNFNVNAFLGKWYISQFYNFGPDFSSLSCYTDLFTLNGNNLLLNVSSYYLNGKKPAFNIPLDLNTFRSGQMKFKLNGDNDVRIASTDYRSYVIWYNCLTTNTGQKVEKIEVAVRSSSTIRETTMRTITNELNRIGFNICEVGFVGRSYCPSV